MFTKIGVQQLYCQACRLLVCGFSGIASKGLKFLARDLELSHQTTKEAMKNLVPTLLLSLLMLAALSFSTSGDVLAQGNSHKNKEFKDKKGGPPAWAPAHGYRSKGGEDDDDDKKYKGKNKKKDKHWKHKEDELEDREEALRRREEALEEKEERLKRAERYPEKNTKKKGGSPGTDVFKKPRTSEPDSSPDKPEGLLKRTRTKLEEKIQKKKEEERRQQEENKNKVPAKTEGGWTGGSGWF